MFQRGGSAILLQPVRALGYNYELWLFYASCLFLKTCFRVLLGVHQEAFLHG